MTRTVIFREFSFNRDFRCILWKKTLGYNFLRNFCAGIICGIIMFLLGNDVYLLVYYPIIWPFAYLIVTPVLIIICGILKGVIPIITYFASFLAIFMVSLGDPIVAIIHVLYPKMVPVNNPPLFSINLLFWVLSAEETAIAGNIFSQKEKTNFIN